MVLGCALRWSGAHHKFCSAAFVKMGGGGDGRTDSKFLSLDAVP